MGWKLIERDVAAKAPARLSYSGARRVPVLYFARSTIDLMEWPDGARLEAYLGDGDLAGKVALVARATGKHLLSGSATTGYRVSLGSQVGDLGEKGSCEVEVDGSHLIVTLPAAASEETPATASCTPEREQSGGEAPPSSSDADEDDADEAEDAPAKPSEDAISAYVAQFDTWIGAYGLGDEAAPILAANKRVQYVIAATAERTVTAFKCTARDIIVGDGKTAIPHAAFVSGLINSGLLTSIVRKATGLSDGQLDAACEKAEEASERNRIVAKQIEAVDTSAKDAFRAVFG